MISNLTQAPIANQRLGFLYLRIILYASDSFLAPTFVAGCKVNEKWAVVEGRGRVLES